MQMRPILSCLMICLLAGCTSSYERHFVSDLGITPPPVSEYAQRNLVAFQGEPEIVKRPMSEELKAELAQQNFVLIGHSTFNSTYANPNQVTDMAMKIGAQLVIVDIQPTHRQTQLEKETDIIPVETTSTTTVHTSDGKTRQRTTVTHVDVEQVQYVPRTYQYYNHAAWFYAKSAK
jgi:hypothetical protein